MATSEKQQDEGLSVLVLASDLGMDARSFLQSSSSSSLPSPLTATAADGEIWHDCPSSLPTFYTPLIEEDFSDIEPRQVFHLEGVDKAGNRILRIVGKHFPAKVICGERLKKFIFSKVLSELQEGPFCIVYMHSTVQKEDNSPGLNALRWIYEELPSEFKDRLRVVYFLHPGLRSRVLLAMLGRFFLSAGLYWKIKYVSRLQYLWEDIRKGQVEIPEFVKEHDNILEHRPLTDYGIEPDPFHLTDPHHLVEPPSAHYSFGRPGDRLGFKAYS